MTTHHNPATAYSPVKGRQNWVNGCLFLLILPVSLLYGLYLTLLHRPLRPEPQIIAHRGAHKGQSSHLPENTLAAFRAAIASGADWIELDVQMTRDGTLVVIHDDTVDRTTNGSGWVKDLTLEEIRALDAGNGEQIPTFDEVLTLAREAGVGVMAEAKSPHLYPGLEAQMVQAIVEADMVDKTAVQAFDPQVLEHVMALNPNIQICPLYRLWVLNLRGPHPGNANIVCPMAEMVVLNPWMIKQAQAEGRMVFVWFGIIEQPLVMRFILALGADGLMVDDPQTLADILRR